MPAMQAMPAMPNPTPETRNAKPWTCSMLHQYRSNNYEIPLSKSLNAGLASSAGPSIITNAHQLRVQCLFNADPTLIKYSFPRPRVHVKSYVWNKSEITIFSSRAFGAGGCFFFKLKNYIEPVVSSRPIFFSKNPMQ